MVPLHPQQLVAFLGAAVLITLAPGPDNLMVLTMGISRGRKEGMTFGLGCALGCISHTMLAAVGLSALVAASRVAFIVLKVCGGLYLLWLGIQALRSEGKSFARGDGTSMPREPLRRLFAKGLLANAVNPKVILFFLAFLPQFVQGARGGIGWQTAQLGIVFTLQAAVLFGVIGYSAGTIGAWLARRPRAGVWLDRVAGGIFSVLGLRLIVTR
jgi:threonine/homoserine/homoserine lactone efflux protein